VLLDNNSANVTESPVLHVSGLVRDLGALEILFLTLGDAFDALEARFLTLCARKSAGALGTRNPGAGYDSTIDFVISCVDTRAARREMHEAFQSRSGPWRHIRYWLDIGNNASNGQFVLGQPLNDINHQSRTRLRTVTELFPSIMDTSQGEGPLPSCSAAEALERQEPFLNSVLAASALAMLTRLLRYGSLDHHGAFYNAEKARIVPIPIDPEVWEKQARRRRAAKAA
jgi:hypothetical protein